MKEVAARVKNEFDGDLRASLVGPITKIRKVLKSLPSIADPGADRILLFAGIQPVAAVPSNCTGVLERIRNGHEEKNYNASYRAAQSIIDSEVPATYDARIRAYLLLCLTPRRGLYGNPVYPEKSSVDGPLRTSRRSLDGCGEGAISFRFSNSNDF